MATTNSDLMANTLATPPAQNDVGKAGAEVRIMQGTFEVADGDFDADGDKIRLIRLPSDARIVSILIANDAMDAGTDSLVNIGFEGTDGTIVDEDEFVSVTAAFQGALALSEYLNEAANNIDVLPTTLWERAGETTNPGGEYDICMYQTAAVTTDAAATISFQVLYTTT